MCWCAGGSWRSSLTTTSARRSCWRFCDEEPELCGKGHHAVNGGVPVADGESNRGVAAVPRALLRSLRQQRHLVLGIAAVVLVGFILSPYFLTGNNMRNIVITGSVVSVLAVGQFMVIVTAGIDLSVGAVAALATVLAAVAMRSGWSPLEAVLLTFVCCTLVGVVNGLLVVYARITPFIATLGML